MHLTLVPYVAAAEEIKTKPTQHSVKELRSIGIQPDILMCRSVQPLPIETREKIALFTNVAVPDVISLSDVQSIYEIPIILQQENVGKRVLEKFAMEPRKADLSEWRSVVDAHKHPEHQVKIAMVGKYTDFADSYKSLNEALIHAGIQTRSRVSIVYVDSEILEEKNGTASLKGVDAILVPGGFGERGVEGKIIAAQYARLHGVPFLGICLGMQIAIVEFARNKVGLENANSTEFDKETPYPVVALVSEWKDQSGKVERRSEIGDMGGTMRLGGQLCHLQPGSLVHTLYGKEQIVERHRHRYEVNNDLLDQLVAAGLVVSGRSSDHKLVEMIELADHPWFVACQFHPEFTSNPRDGHPLFTGFVKAALAQSNIVSEKETQ